MPEQVSKFEAHRTQLAESLITVAESMRNCAQIAESFAKIVNDSSYSPEAAEVLNGALENHAKGKRKADLSPEEDDGPKKRKRNAKPKDPNAPKRPASSYILFQNDNRKPLKEKYPQLSNAELLAMISDLWKNLSDTEREVYNNQTKIAKEQYSEKKKAYDDRTPEQIEADTAAALAAQSLKKANAKPRGPKPHAAAAIEIKARPPPPPEAVAASSDSSEEEESEEDQEQEQEHNSDSDSSEVEEEDADSEPEPAPKKRRAESVKPPAKSKKSSKA